MTPQEEADLARAVEHLRAKPIEGTRYYAWYLHRCWFAAPDHRLSGYGLALMTFSEPKFADMRYAAYDKLRPTRLPSWWNLEHQRGYRYQNRDGEERFTTDKAFALTLDGFEHIGVDLETGREIAL